VFWQKVGSTWGAGPRNLRCRCAFVGLRRSACELFASAQSAASESRRYLTLRLARVGSAFQLFFKRSSACVLRRLWCPFTLGLRAIRTKCRRPGSCRDCRRYSHYLGGPGRRAFRVELAVALRVRVMRSSYRLTSLYETPRRFEGCCLCSGRSRQRLVRAGRTPANRLLHVGLPQVGLEHDRQEYPQSGSAALELRGVQDQWTCRSAPRSTALG